jgi:integrase
MDEHIEVHDYKQRMERLERRIRSSIELTDENKIAILDFQNHCFSEGMSEARVVKYMDTLYRIAKLIGKNFREVNKTDIQNFVKNIEMNRSYSDWTKHDYKVILKIFFRWLKQTEEYPEEVKWVKTAVKNSNHKLPEEMLTEDEVKRILEATEHPRDRAFIAVLYESGCRIGEILTLRLKHVQADKYGAKIMVSGKTGMRSVRLIASAPYLLTWVNIHPVKDNPNVLSGLN